MKKLFTTLTGTGAAIVTYLSLALPASAQVAVNPCPNGSGGGTNFNVLCSLTANNIGSVVSAVVTILLIAAALIALFFLIVGGIRWITSGGDKSKVESARNTIIASIIGLVIALLAFFIITVVLGIFGLSLTNLQLPRIVSTTTTVPNTVVSQSHEDAPKISVFAENLEVPWGMAFLPDQSMLVTERPGRVRVIDAQGVMRSNPVATISDVYANGEGGLLGVAVHPKFSENHFVYLYYSYQGSAGSMKNKVVRYVFDGTSLTDPKTIIDNIPGNSNHDGGRIKFGPDNFLYITTGDSEDPSLAQNKDALAGKILRLTDDGQPASGNPFNTPIYSYGHRNPQGIAWDSDNRIWATEHGRSSPTGYDEINLIEKGQNYGWPTIQGDEQKEGMVTPVINSGPDTTWAPSGVAYLNGSLFFGGLKGQALYEAVLNGTKVTDLKKHFDGELGRIRDVVLGPDGFLYITTSNRDGRGTPQENDDKIYRINRDKL